ncbi:hypothetical protein QAD02_006293 [Eretmocerus hayati]|uniref:Uncharacterized protein n=1 Tax=Eretmocerus hayati TaxID=131215 RepID=A0ACC2N1L9_9HYME|nr:hypothetical protein QAD02_006293 [Eretmocerus hayati]
MKDTGNKKDKNQLIKVLVSVRPFNGAGRASKSPVVVDVQVFGPSSKQLDVYHAVVNPLLEEVLADYNCIVFDYSQTGTGKNFTIEGLCHDPAVHWRADTPAEIIPRALSHLFGGYAR